MEAHNREEIDAALALAAEKDQLLTFSLPRKISFLQ